MAVVVGGANVHDSLLLQDALEQVVVEPPNPYMELKQHLCLDKAFACALQWYRRLHWLTT